MKIEDYVLLYHSNIKTIIKNNPTDFTEDSLIKIMIESINQLKDVRLDKWATEEEITNILRCYKRPRRSFNGEFDYYENAIDSNILSHMLLAYCKREKSYHYSYVFLQQEINRRIALPENICFFKRTRNRRCSIT